MAAAAPAIPWITGASLGLGLVNTVAEASRASSAANAQADAARARAENERQMMQRQYEIESRKRAEALARSQARARVSFGARGLSSTEGSAGALLNGIEADAGVEAKDARAMFDWRLGGLDAGLAASLQSIDSQRPNLLSTSQKALGQVNELLKWGKSL